MAQILHNPNIEPICAVDDPMIIEWNKGKYTSAFRGSKPSTYILSELQSGSREPIMQLDQPGFVMVDIPVINGKQVLFDFNAKLTVRFLSAGSVYSFKTGFLWVLSKPSVIVLEYPVNLERHNLRGNERMKFLAMVEVEEPEAGKKRMGAITDLSPNGAMVGLEDAGTVRVGSKLILSFDLSNGDKVDSLKATVRNSRMEEGKFFFGVSFDKDFAEKLHAIHKYYDRYTSYLHGIK